jgi:hypothetical protein
MKAALKYVQSQVNIPNLEGDGIAEVITIKIPVELIRTPVKKCSRLRRWN